MWFNLLWYLTSPTVKICTKFGGPFCRLVMHESVCMFCVIGWLFVEQTLIQPYEKDNEQLMVMETAYPTMFEWNSHWCIWRNKDRIRNLTDMFLKDANSYHFADVFKMRYEWFRDSVNWLLWKCNAAQNTLSRCYSGPWLQEILNSRLLKR